MPPVPVSSANPFMSPLSCLSPLCPAAESSPGGLQGSASPSALGGLTKAGKSPGVPACSEAPAGEGAELFQRAELSHPHLLRRLTRVIWAHLFGSRLGTVAISAGDGGAGGLAESRGGVGGPRSPGNRWQPLVDAKTLRCLPGSRSCRRSVCRQPGSVPSARLRAHRLSQQLFYQKDFHSVSLHLLAVAVGWPVPSEGLGQLQPLVAWGWQALHPACKMFVYLFFFKAKW